jgi:hypothetical protein
MLRELNSTDQWSEFMSRMRHQFEELLESKPACLQDMVQELREHEDSITFLDIVRDNVPTVEGHRSDNPPDPDASVSATMPRFKDRGSSARKPNSSMTLCCSLPKQHRCSPQPI